MAMIHYLQLGHFILYEGFVKYNGGQPATTHNMNLNLLKDISYIKHNDEEYFPAALAEYDILAYPDRLICNRYSDHMTLLIMAEVADKLDAMIVDVGSFDFVCPKDLRRHL